MVRFVKYLIGQQKENFSKNITTLSGSTQSILKIDSSQPDNFFRQKVVELPDGEQRHIAAWDLSSTSLTLRTPLAQSAPASGVNLKIYDGGLFDTRFIIDALNAAQDLLVSEINPGVLHDFKTWSDTTGVKSTTDPYASAELPEGMVDVTDVIIDGEESTIAHSFHQLKNSSFCGTSHYVMGVQLNQSEKKQLLYRPNKGATVRYRYIKHPKRIDMDIDCELPDTFHSPICREAVSVAFNRNHELASLGVSHHDAFLEFIIAKNRKFEDVGNGKLA